jgi:hypothetical protein
MAELNKYLSEFNPALFWDTDMKNIHPEDHSHYIIERVVTRGNMDDWRRIKAMYSLEKLQEASIQSRVLDKKTLNFLSLHFNTPY